MKGLFWFFGSCLTVLEAAITTTGMQADQLSPVTTLSFALAGVVIVLGAFLWMFNTNPDALVKLAQSKMASQNNVSEDTAREILINKLDESTEVVAVEDDGDDERLTDADIRDLLAERQLRAAGGDRDGDEGA